MSVKVNHQIRYVLLDFSDFECEDEVHSEVMKNIVESLIRFIHYVALFESESMLISIIVCHKHSFEVVIKPAKFNLKDIYKTLTTLLTPKNEKRDSNAKATSSGADTGCTLSLQHIYSYIKSVKEKTRDTVTLHLSYFTTLATLTTVSTPQSLPLLDSCLKQLHDGYTFVEFILLLSPLFNSSSSSSSSSNYTSTLASNSLSSFSTLLRDNIHCLLKSFSLDPFSLERLIKSWVPPTKSSMTLHIPSSSNLTSDSDAPNIQIQIECDVHCEYRSVNIDLQRLCSCHHQITETFDHCKTTKNILIDKKIYSPTLSPHSLNPTLFPSLSSSTPRPSSSSPPASLFIHSKVPLSSLSISLLSNSLSYILTSPSPPTPLSWQQIFQSKQRFRAFLSSLSQHQRAVMCYTINSSLGTTETVSEGEKWGYREWWVIIAEEKGRESAVLRRVVSREEYWRVEVEEEGKLGAEEEGEEERMVREAMEGVTEKEGGYSPLEYESGFQKVVVEMMKEDEKEKGRVKEVVGERKVRGKAVRFQNDSQRDTKIEGHEKEQQAVGGKKAKGSGRKAVRFQNDSQGDTRSNNSNNSVNNKTSRAGNTVAMPHKIL